VTRLSASSAVGEFCSTWLRMSQSWFDTGLASNNNMALSLRIGRAAADFGFLSCGLFCCRHRRTSRFRRSLSSMRVAGRRATLIRREHVSHMGSVWYSWIQLAQSVDVASPPFLIFGRSGSWNRLLILVNPAPCCPPWGERGEKKKMCQSIVYGRFCVSSQAGFNIEFGRHLGFWGR